MVKIDPIEFFEENALAWNDRVLGRKDKKYPNALIRMGIVLEDITRYEKSQSICDLGCGGGDFLNKCGELGFTDLKGYDNSTEMVSQANQQPYVQGRCEVQDVQTLLDERQYDIVTAMGLVEYLPDHEQFSKVVEALGTDNSVMYFSGRSRLFDLYAGSREGMNDPKQLATLADEIALAHQYLPVKEHEVAMQQFMDCIRPMSQLAFTVGKQDKQLQGFSEIDRSKETPSQIKKIVKDAGYALEWIQFFHAHPMPPQFKNINTDLFDQMSLFMEPLGKTALGPYWCSGYFAKGSRR